jgi:hypothetical protein
LFQKTKQELRKVIEQYYSNKEDTIKQYGEINNWDV